MTPSQAFAQARNVVEVMREAAGSAPITVTKLRSNVSVLEGAGGNIAVLNGPDGNLLVDAGITASRPRIIEAIDSLGGGPIRYVVNTHWHFDHADGNEWLNSQGAVIVAHENARKHLAEATRVDDWDFNFPPSPAGAVPSELVSDEKKMEINGSAVMLKYYGPSHTDGDISARFDDADIIHTGDTYWNGFYPFIDYSTGGSIDGTIKAAEATIRASSDNTIIIPGHGPVSSKKELVEYYDLLRFVREKIAALKDKGHSLEEVLAAKTTEALDAKWGAFAVKPQTFVKLVYVGV